MLLFILMLAKNVFCRILWFMINIVVHLKIFFSRNAEKQFVAESDEIEPGTEWDRISKLCDFNPKSSRASKDVTRMRSIILQLKQTPLKKPVSPAK